MPICKYCKNDRELCESHAIPDGIFKPISRRNNGQLITIPAGAGNIHLSQDTGKSKLLCKECEGYFNREFDGPLVNAFKAWDRKVTKEGFGVRFEFPPNQMAQGLASISWRASVSGNNMYANAKVSNRDNSHLLSIVDGDQNKTLKSCSCSIKRLYDKRTPPKGGFSQEIVSQIILPVNSYRISWGRKKPSTYFAFAVLMQGFLCHLTIPRLPHGKRVGSEFLSSTKGLLHAPPQYLFDYKPLRNAMVEGVRKHLEGHSTLKDQKDRA